jgi:hypothetical protein
MKFNISTNKDGKFKVLAKMKDPDTGLVVTVKAKSPTKITWWGFA